jgi:hypothetical protein
VQKEILNLNFVDLELIDELWVVDILVVYCEQLKNWGLHSVYQRRKEVEVFDHQPVQYCDKIIYMMLQIKTAWISTSPNNQTILKSINTSDPIHKVNYPGERSDPEKSNFAIQGFQ